MNKQSGVPETLGGWGRERRWGLDESRVQMVWVSIKPLNPTPMQTICLLGSHQKPKKPKKKNLMRVGLEPTQVSLLGYSKFVKFSLT